MIEKFLAVLTALVAAIEANTAALKGAAVAPAAAGAKTETKKEKEARLAAEAAVLSASTTATTTVTPVTATVATFPAQEELTKVANALLDENDNQDGGFFAEIKKKYSVDKVRNVAEKDRADVIKLINDKRAELKTAKASATAGKNDI